MAQVWEKDHATLTRRDLRHSASAATKLLWNKTATHDKYIEFSRLWCNVFSLIIDLAAKINTDVVISI